jgi:hypothetical protein
VAGLAWSPARVAIIDSRRSFLAKTLIMSATIAIWRSCAPRSRVPDLE